MLRVGLTGGIACGKSAVAAGLARCGLPVLDADRLARRVVEPGTPGHAAIVARFGPGVLDAGRRVDRERLGRLVFGDPVARADLEAITHPRIAEAAEAELGRLEAEGARIAVYEAALIVEAGLVGRFDLLVVVAARPETQLARLALRDGLGQDGARARLAAQAPLERKVALADHVVWNDGSLDELEGEVARLCEVLEARAREGRGDGRR